MLEPKYTFSSSYVLKTTFKHMKRSIDISIAKSFERFKDFDSDNESGNEIMHTLSVLHDIKKRVETLEAESIKRINKQ